MATVLRGGGLDDPLAAGENDLHMYIDGLVREEYAETTITRRVASASKFYIYQRNDLRHSEELDNPTEDISLPRDCGIQNLSEYVRVLDQEGKINIISHHWWSSHWNRTGRAVGLISVFVSCSSSVRDATRSACPSKLHGHVSVSRCRRVYSRSSHSGHVWEIHASESTVTSMPYSSQTFAS